MSDVKLDFGSVLRDISQLNEAIKQIKVALTEVQQLDLSNLTAQFSQMKQAVGGATQGVRSAIGAVGAMPSPPGVSGISPPSERTKQMRQQMQDQGFDSVLQHAIEQQLQPPQSPALQPLQSAIPPPGAQPAITREIPSLYTHDTTRQAFAALDQFGRQETSRKELLDRLTAGSQGDRFIASQLQDFTKQFEKLSQIQSELLKTVNQKPDDKKAQEDLRKTMEQLVSVNKEIVALEKTGRSSIGGGGDGDGMGGGGRMNWRSLAPIAMNAMQAATIGARLNAAFLNEGIQAPMQISGNIAGMNAMEFQNQMGAINLASGQNAYRYYGDVLMGAGNTRFLGRTGRQRALDVAETINEQRIRASEAERTASILSNVSGVLGGAFSGAVGGATVGSVLGVAAIPAAVGGGIFGGLSALGRSDWGAGNLSQQLEGGTIWQQMFGDRSGNISAAAMSSLTYERQLMAQKLRDDEMQDPEVQRRAMGWDVWRQTYQVRRAASYRLGARAQFGTEGAEGAFAQNREFAAQQDARTGAYIADQTAELQRLDEERKQLAQQYGEYKPVRFDVQGYREKAEQKYLSPIERMMGEQATLEQMTSVAQADFERVKNVPQSQKENARRQMEIVNKLATANEEQQAITRAENDKRLRAVADVYGQMEWVPAEAGQRMNVLSEAFGSRGRASLGQAIELEKIARSGYGDFETLAGNVSGLRRMTGQSTQDLNQLKTVMTEAMKAGFDGSQAAQKFVNAVQQLAQAQGTTDVAEGSARLRAGALMSSAMMGAADIGGRSFEFYTQSAQQWQNMSTSGMLSQQMRTAAGMQTGMTIQGGLGLAAQLTDAQQAELQRALSGEGPAPTDMRTRLLYDEAKATGKEKQLSAQLTSMRQATVAPYNAALRAMGAPSITDIVGETNKTKQQEMLRRAMLVAPNMEGGVEGVFGAVMAQMKNSGASQKDVDEFNRRVSTTATSQRDDFAAVQKSVQTYYSLRAQSEADRNLSSKEYSDYIKSGGTPIRDAQGNVISAKDVASGTQTVTAKQVLTAQAAMAAAEATESSTKIAGLTPQAQRDFISTMVFSQQLASANKGVEWMNGDIKTLDTGASGNK